MAGAGRFAAGPVGVIFHGAAEAAAQYFPHTGVVVGLAVGAFSADLEALVCGFQGGAAGEHDHGADGIGSL